MRRKDEPFRVHATFPLTIPQFTPPGQHSRRVQMPAPFPLAEEHDPKQGPSEAMGPQPKRLRPDDSTDAPPAAVLPSAAAVSSVVAPPPVAGTLNVLSQRWTVWGNDPNDAAGVRSVLLAEHSRGKPEEMVRAAFPQLVDEDVASFVKMDAFNVWRYKKGGNNVAACADAVTTCKKLIELADKHGSDLRVWGCGGAMDRIVQISSLTGFVQTNNMRPVTSVLSRSSWVSLGICPSLSVNSPCT